MNLKRFKRWFAWFKSMGKANGAIFKKMFRRRKMKEGEVKGNEGQISRHQIMFHERFKRIIIEHILIHN